MHTPSYEADLSILTLQPGKLAVQGVGHSLGVTRVFRGGGPSASGGHERSLVMELMTGRGLGAWPAGRGG